MKNFLYNFSVKFKDKDFIFKFSLFAFYFALHLILCFFHEPWRDEAQAYLIVRDLSIPELIRQLTVEGHPFLWYLAMLLPVKLGLSVHFLSLVSFILSAVGTYVFIFKAPFKTYIKAPILLGMIFMYSLPIIARDYCLVALILPLIACYYEKRFKKPVIYGVLIFLLLQVHVIMAGFAIMLALVSLIETLVCSEKRKHFKSYIPFIFGLLGTLVLIFQLRAGSNLMELNSSNLGEFLLNIFSDIPLFIKSMVKGCMDAVQYFWEIPYRPLLIGMVILMFIGFAANIALIKYYWREFLIVFGGMGAHIFIHVYIWGYIPQRTICTMFIWLVYVWMICGRKNIEFKKEGMALLSKIFKRYIVAVTVLLSVISYPLSFTSIINEFKGNYSGAEETALFIKNELPDDAIVVSAAKDFYMTPIVAQFDYNENKLWNPMTQNYEHTFVDWNNRGIYVPDFAELENRIKSNFNPSQSIYILEAEGSFLDGCSFENYKPVFSQKDTPCAWGETYTIYKYEWE